VHGLSQFHWLARLSVISGRLAFERYAEQESRHRKQRVSGAHMTSIFSCGLSIALHASQFCNTSLCAEAFAPIIVA
jgi:hypothetical protein